MTKATWINDDIKLMLVYSFRGSVHYHQGRKHSRTGQAWSCEFNILFQRKTKYYCLQPCKRRVSKPIPQWHASSNKVAPIPTRPHRLIALLFGPSIFKPPCPLRPDKAAFLGSGYQSDNSFRESLCSSFLGYTICKLCCISATKVAGASFWPV